MFIIPVLQPFGWVQGWFVEPVVGEESEDTAICASGTAATQPANVTAAPNAISGRYNAHTSASTDEVPYCSGQLARVDAASRLGSWEIGCAARLLVGDIRRPRDPRAKRQRFG
jgi:hypothetical protein